MKNKKVLILTLSCNIPLFKALLGAVRDTWAKPLLHNQYSDYIWFAYTSCDKKHSHPYIDWNDHMIYVNCKDGIYDTYTKTQLAYNMILQSGLKFDYVLRTNTSVFVNLNRLDKAIEELTLADNKVLGGLINYYHVFNSEYHFKWHTIPGIFMCMKKELFDIMLSATNNYDTIPAADDVIMSGILFEKLGDKIKVISPNNWPTVFPRYKSSYPEDFDRVKLSDKDIYVDDPNIINDHVVVQVRTYYGDILERSEKGHEVEHFYELNDALNYE